MKKIISFFVSFFVLITGTAIAENRYIVRDDGGGVVSEYQQAVEYFKREKILLKVDGYCASACTLILNKEAKIDVCVTSKASFLIHSPYAMIKTPDGSMPAFLVLTAVTADRILKEQFLAVYPEWLIDYLKDKRIPSVAMGDATNDMVEVNFEILSNHLPVCSEHFKERRS